MRPISQLLTVCRVTCSIPASASCVSPARTRSRLSAAVQLLSFTDFTFFGNRGLWTINEAESVEQFRGLRGDLNLLSLGSYIAELLESVSNEDVPEPEILQLGLNALFALSNRVCPPEQVKAAFELRLMCLSGYRPELDACAACGRAAAGCASSSTARTGTSRCRTRCR